MRLGWLDERAGVFNELPPLLSNRTVPDDSRTGLMLDTTMILLLVPSNPWPGEQTTVPGNVTSFVVTGETEPRLMTTAVGVTDLEEGFAGETGCMKCCCGGGVM